MSHLSACWPRLAANWRGLPEDVRICMVVLTAFLTIAALAYWKVGRA